jgi:hypothetical protein
MPDSKTDVDRLKPSEINRVVDERVRNSMDILMSQRRLMWRAFLHGAFAGLGGVVGATVGVALLLGVLRQVGGLPGIGNFLEQNVTNKIEQGRGE